jgi:hypothetical protein
MHATLTRFNDSGFRRLLKRLALIGLVSALFALVVSPAAAAGRVIWKQTTIQEHTKKEAWYVDLEIHLPRAPDVGQKAMKFEFTQTAEFERSLVDGREDPQERTIPLTNQQALIESQLVGFMDPGSGTIQKRTRFSFKVTRAHGYRAGQYQVKIKDADSGQVIGVPTALTFKGENPVVDRRSIVFTGAEKKKDKDSADSSASGPKNMMDLNAPDEPAAASAPRDRSDEPPEEPMDEGDAPPSVEERPGGGCHYGAHEAANYFNWGGIFALFGLVLMARRRLS